MIQYELHKDYDPKLENNVLGVCLFIPTAFSVVFSMTNEDCYHVSKHKAVFKAMHRVFEAGLPIDANTVLRDLYDNNVMEMEGHNTGYVLGLMMYEPVSDAHLEAWCVMLKELAARRLMKKITTQGFKGDDLVDSISEIEKQLKSVLDIRVTNDWVDSSVVALRVSKHMEEAAGRDMVGITTTISDLDRINGGFRSGQMVVIGARPSMGKSAFMGRLASRIAKAGHIVGVISLEMEAKDIQERMISADSNVPFYAIDRAKFRDDAERNFVNTILSQQALLPIYYSDSPSVNIHDIRSKAEKLKREKGLDILFIDYLQLIEDGSKGNKVREQIVSEISRGIKKLAMSLKIPIVVLAQLNRASLDAKDVRPQLHHLRESGSIEQDADVVMFLHRDYMSGKEQDALGNSTKDNADLLIRKWRNGAPVEISLKFDADKMKFYLEDEEPAFRTYKSFETQGDNPRAGIANNNFNADDWKQ